MRKRKNFLVIAEDEPYFMKAYRLIRKNEKANGTWSDEDERIYQSAQQMLSDDKPLNDPVYNVFYNAALEWAADWITGPQMEGHSEEVQQFAKNMAMSLRAARRPTEERQGVASYEVYRCPHCEGLSYHDPSCKLSGACEMFKHLYVDGVCARCGKPQGEK